MECLMKLQAVSRLKSCRYVIGWLVGWLVVRSSVAEQENERKANRRARRRRRGGGVSKKKGTKTTDDNATELDNNNNNGNAGKSQTKRKEKEWGQIGRSDSAIVSFFLFVKILPDIQMNVHHCRVWLPSSWRRRRPRRGPDRRGCRPWSADTASGSRAASATRPDSAARLRVPDTHTHTHTDTPDQNRQHRPSASFQPRRCRPQSPTSSTTRSTASTMSSSISL